MINGTFEHNADEANLYIPLFGSVGTIVVVWTGVSWKERILCVIYDDVIAPYF